MGPAGKQKANLFDGLLFLAASQAQYDMNDTVAHDAIAPERLIERNKRVMIKTDSIATPYQPPSEDDSLLKWRNAFCVADEFRQLFHSRHWSHDKAYLATSK